MDIPMAIEINVNNRIILKNNSFIDKQYLTYQLRSRAQGHLKVGSTLQEPNVCLIDKLVPKVYLEMMRIAAYKDIAMQ
jgi:hypothetical protein